MNLTAVDITTSSVLLNWTEPNGQSSRYRVEYDDKNVIAENTSIMLNDLFLEHSTHSECLQLQLIM